MNKIIKNLICTTHTCINETIERKGNNVNSIQISPSVGLECRLTRR